MKRKKKCESAGEISPERVRDGGSRMVSVARGRKVSMKRSLCLIWAAEGMGKDDPGDLRVSVTLGIRQLPEI